MAEIKIQIEGEIQIASIYVVYFNKTKEKP